MEGKLILIDSHSLANRAFFALQQPMNTKTGQPTNAVYGVAMMLTKLLDEEKPDYIIATFDTGKPTFRHEAYDQYKAGRRPMADELRSQIPLVRRLFEVFQIPVLERIGFEADDLLGTLACRGSEAGLDVFIITGDRDSFQLVNSKVKVIYTKKGISEVERVGPEEVWERYQLRPEQLIELKGLMGDSSDNIPGVPGFGEKTAIRLIQRFGDIPNLLEHLDELERPKERELLTTYREMAIQSRELATIHCQVDIPNPWEDGRWTGANRQDLAAFFTEMEFKTLLRRFQLDSAKPTASAAPAEPAGKSFVFPEFTTMTADEAEGLSEKLGQAPVALQLVTEHLQRGQTRITGAAFGCRERGYFYMPLSEGRLPAAIQRWLADRDAPKDAFDAKELMRAVAWSGGELNGVRNDLRLAGHLAGASGGDYSLTELTRRFLGWDELPAGSEPEQATLAFDMGETEAHSDADARAAIAQVHAIAELVTPLEDELRAMGMANLYRSVEVPLVGTLFHMEEAGISIDPDKLRQLGAGFRLAMACLEKEIYDLAGEAFNIGSPKQMGYILFEKLGLPTGKKTKSGYSTDAEVLEALAERYPVAEKILAYRGLAKLNSTYVEALITQADPKTQKIHTTFQQTVTATGRLSSTEPNLQNIPVRTPEGREIREAFLPSPGHILLAADYSQIELRIMAHFSQDPKYMAAFLEGDDIHIRTAAEIFGVPVDGVTKELRDRAKAVNFGILYGISGFGLAKGTGVSRREAEDYIAAYFQRYEGVQRFLDEVIAKAREDGYVGTWLGRRRNLPDLHSSNFPRRSFAERTARNTPIQGTAADIIKLAMLRVEERLVVEKLPATLLLQVHDELVLETDPEALPEVAKAVREAMEGAVQLSVPLTVEVKTGLHWGGMRAMGKED